MFLLKFLKQVGFVMFGRVRNSKSVMDSYLLIDDGPKFDFKFNFRFDFEFKSGFNFETSSSSKF